MKVLLATTKPFALEAVERIQQIIESAGYELLKLQGYSAKAQLLSAVADADALIVRSDMIDSEVMARLYV